MKDSERLQKEADRTRNKNGYTPILYEFVAQLAKVVELLETLVKEAKRGH